MCRWLAYYGDPIPIETLVFRRQHSLIDQSLHSRMGATTTNGDGFGIGWYNRLGGTPAVYRSVHPAWNDRNLRELAAHVSSPLFFAHIEPRPERPCRRRTRIRFDMGAGSSCTTASFREFPRMRRDLLLSVDPELLPEIEGSTDSELLFYLALTFGLERSAVEALERMAGLVEDLGEKHGVDDPLQTSVAVTDGERIIAARYSSEGKRSLYFSTHARVLKEQYLDMEELQALSDEARAVVSEPLGDLVGAWNEVPESSIGIVQPGQDELRPFTPQRGVAAGRSASPQP